MKTPEGMIAKPPTTADLLKEAQLRIGVLEERSNKLQRQADDMRHECDDAMTEATETRNQFADLKRRLYESEMKMARLNGYVDRVRDNDHALEEPFIVERTEQVPVPRSPPVMKDAAEMWSDQTIRPHWTSYGNG